MRDIERDRIKREIGYGTGGIAEKMKEVELVVVHKVPEKEESTVPADQEPPVVTILDND